MRLSTALPLLLSSLTLTYSLPLTPLTPSDWQSIKSSLHFPSVESTLEEAKSWIEWEGRKNDADDQKTIWQLLNEDSGRYSKLLKAIEIEGGGAKSVLDNRDMSITFFAPEDSGIPDPHHDHDHDHDHDEETAIKSLLRTPTLSNILHVHSLHSTLSHDHDHDGDDDEEKKKRRRIFKYILGQVLKYHGLPEALTGAELAGNKSVATALYPKFGSNDGQPLRIHLEKKLVPPSLELNFYAKVVVSHSDRKAINGYLHEISHPLLPPPSILDESFLSRKFDTFTTALQKVKGEGAVAWQFSPELSKEQHHPVFVGAPAVTAFIPTNAAFALLPEKLQFFLFSPFGQNVLAKILSYHVLDKYVVFTESIHKDGEKGDRDPHDHHGHHGKHGKHGKHHHHHDDEEEEEHEKRSWSFDEAVAEVEALGLGDDNDPSFHLEEEFPTLLSGGHLKVVIDKSKVLPVPGATKVTLSVNGIEAEEIDIPSLNGVFHVIPEVLKPPHKHEDDEGRLVESGWEDWEEWLVQWADSQ